MDIKAILTPAQYVLSKCGPKTKMQLAKILYFADKEHISIYGRQFTDDVYCAMPKGPVPSKLNDCLNAVSGNNCLREFLNYRDEINKHVKCTGIWVSHQGAPDLDYLSKSAIKCLDAAISLNAHKSADELSEQSHDSAWEAARKKSTKNNNPIDVIEMAKAANASQGTIKYIEETLP